MKTDKLDLSSPDLVNQNIEKIAALFPNCVTETAEGKAIDFDALKQELNHEVVEGAKERYRLEWPGKKEAIVTANLPTTKTLRPVREDSVDFDTTENMYIEGDNLEVLKILQESYLGKIKMIYIDPPYNTGKDFVYKDNFTQDSADYKEETDQTDEYGNRLVANPETAGRYHSDWLSMMYPRLKLARNLLTDDGVIFMSIDDNEVHNLRKVGDEIFGENSFITSFCWEKKKKPSFLNKNLGSKFEYILVYAKNRSSTYSFSVDLTTQGKKYPFNNAGNSLSTLKFPSNSVKFNIDDQTILPQDMSEGKIKTKLLNNLIIKNGVNQNEFELEGEWRYSQNKLNEIVNNSEEIIISKIPFRPNHVKTGGEIKKMHNLLTIKHYSIETNEDADAQQTQLLGQSFFDYAKPIGLIKLLIKAYTYNDSNPLILDFFSGSATTAHAVLQLNAEDGGNRKFIMAQLPEVTYEGVTEKYKDEDGKEKVKYVIDKETGFPEIKKDSEARKAGYYTIPQIGKERIRRAAAKIKEETVAEIDYGFKVFKVDSSNMQDVYYKPQDYNQGQLDVFADNIKEDRTSEDLLTQILLDWGLPLTLKTETLTIQNKEVFKVDTNYLMACFAEGVDEAFAKEIATYQPLRVVFKDSGFKDDTAKENVKQLLKQLSPNTEMKVI